MKEDSDSEVSNVEIANRSSLNCRINLVNIHFPGYVNNVDKAIAILGGIKSIENASSTAKTNLELRFRPNNLHSKPVVSDRDAKPSILLRLKVKKKVVNDKVISQEIIDYDIAGISAVNFKFTKLCDYQYLPLLPENPEEKEENLQYVYKNIVPEELPTDEWLNEPESKSDPLYYCPLLFSKTNSSTNKPYFERSKHYEGFFQQLLPELYSKFKERDEQNIGNDVPKSKNYIQQATHLCSFDDDVPTEPKKNALLFVEQNDSLEPVIAKLKQIFEEQPIWSKAALQYFTALPKEKLKFALPMVAFHYLSGPWRAMWVRFGYDPKHEPEARSLQTFDYRVRSNGGFKANIQLKRVSKNNPEKDFVFGATSGKAGGDEAHKGRENTVFLRHGLLPAARQMFYQYCHLQLPEIETMISRLPQVTAGNQCHWKHGWLPRGFADHCREAANKYVRDFIREQNARKIEGGKKSPNSTDLELSSSSGSEESEVEEQDHSADNDYDIEDSFDMEAVADVNEIINMAKNINTNNS